MKIPINNRLATQRAVAVGGINMNSPTINLPDGVDVETIRSLVRQIGSQQYNAYKDSSPFSDKILVAPLPTNFKVIPDLKYDRTTDLRLHLMRFIAEIQLYQHPHHEMQVFPLTRTDTAHR